MMTIQEEFNCNYLILDFVSLFLTEGHLAMLPRRSVTQRYFPLAVRTVLYSLYS